jgi:RNA polymerase-associated protein LEO1
MADLNDLLGSEDEDDYGEEEKVSSQPKEEKKDSNLNDLLGSDDDEAEDDKPAPPAAKKEKTKDVNSYLGDSGDEMEIDELPPAQPTTQKNELDHIFGRVATETDSKSKQKIKTQLNLGPAFKVDSNLKTIFLRTPNFVKIQTNPYNADEYDMNEEKKEFDGATSVIRYRLDGKQLASNARLIKWSDGTQQLIVGDAVFDMKIVPTDNW